MSVDTWYEVRAGADWVRASSATRLTFEPKGDMRQFRSDLRVALKKLKPRPGAGLSATYASPRDDYVDLENASLYNVGMGAFGHLLDLGVSCRRTRSDDGLHHLTYRVTDLSDPAPEADRLLAHIDTDSEAGLPRQHSTVLSWWEALWPFIDVDSLDGTPRTFALDVIIDAQWTGTRLANALKPMLDGITSALSAHDGTQEGPLRQALQRHVDADVAWARLTDSSRAVLGVQTLLRPYRGGLYWNPPDHLCTGFRVGLRPNSNRTISFALRGRSTAD